MKAWHAWAIGGGVAMGALGLGPVFASRSVVLPAPEPLPPRAVPSAEEPSRTVAIAISSSQVTVSGKLVDTLGRDEQFALRSKAGADFTESLVEALKPALAPGGDIVVSVEPDVAYLSVARVALVLLDLGHESVSLKLSAGPTRVALARKTFSGPEDGDGLLVLMATLGVGIKAPGGNIAPGCQGLGPGLAIPRVEGRVALGALRDCVARLIHVDSRLGRAYLDANLETPFRDIVETADALAAGGAPLIGLRLGS